MQKTASSCSKFVSKCNDVKPPRYSRIETFILHWLGAPLPFCLLIMSYNLSFAGSGFLGIYHLGAADALINHGGKLLAGVEQYAGASAGSLIAAAFAIKTVDAKTLKVDEVVN